MDTATLTVDEFIVIVGRIYQENPSWRYGQAFFNCLNSIRPQLAETIRGTRLDPFHKDEVNNETWKFIISNWE